LVLAPQAELGRLQRATNCPQLKVFALALIAPTLNAVLSSQSLKIEVAFQKGAFDARWSSSTSGAELELWPQPKRTPLGRLL
jgi:hypothetical protein